MAVHLWTSQPEAELHALLDQVEARDGWLDGYIPGRLLVLTFPVEGGFARVEEVLDAYGLKHDEEWYCGNVYDEAGAPLCWWVRPA